MLNVINLQVGAIDVDSEWETGFNDFIFNSKKYPNASYMVIDSAFVVVSSQQ